MAAPYRNGGGCRAQENTGAAVIAFVCFNSSTLGGRRLRSRRPPRPLSLPVSFFLGVRLGLLLKTQILRRVIQCFLLIMIIFLLRYHCAPIFFFVPSWLVSFRRFFCVGLCVPGAFLSVLFVFLFSFRCFFFFSYEMLVESTSHCFPFGGRPCDEWNVPAEVQPPIINETEEEPQWQEAEPRSPSSSVMTS